MEKRQVIKNAIAKLLFWAIILTPLCTFAQSPDDDLDPPCGGSEVYDNECPIDTWVMLLVAVALIFGAYQIYIRNKNRIAVS